ncbi:unnamed protein product [Arabis nemorensis]|uniref:Uncharacterized protein n=1 Tax=Arabis nemorensis TaxID=586526 RepID=A0A565CFQ9_9BRAS|nr:unnamed protein product [Arabis nemorensis]
MKAGIGDGGFTQAAWYWDSVEEAMLVSQANLWKPARATRPEATRQQTVMQRVSVGASVGRTVHEMGLEGIISPLKGLFPGPGLLVNTDFGVSLGPKNMKKKGKPTSGKKAKNILGVRKKIGHSPYQGVRVQQQASAAVKTSLRDNLTLCELPQPPSSRTATSPGESSKKRLDPVVGEKPPSDD